MISGIYEIRCTANGKRYIGSALNIKRRWGHHKTALVRGKHHNVRLQRTWNKYGRESFVFSVIEETSADLLLTAEQEHMDASAAGTLLNLRHIAASNVGLHHSVSTRQLISAASSSRMADPARRAQATAVLAVAQSHEALSHNAKWERTPETIATLSGVRKQLFQDDAHIRQQVLAAGQTSATRRAAKTHCKHGHEFTPENTYRSVKQRHCRKCRATRAAGYKEARSAA